MKRPILIAIFAGGALAQPAVGVYPQSYGAKAGDDTFDNAPAINAAQQYAAAHSLPVLIQGRLAVKSPIFPLSNTTWLGVSQDAEIVGLFPAQRATGVMIFAGTYTDYPAILPYMDSHPPAVIGIAPAARGSLTLTARPAGGFSNISAGDWILLAEGNAPKWNTYISYHTVRAKSRDVLTLDRPTEFDFTGSTGATTFGVIRIQPVRNVTVKDLTITVGNNNTPYNFLSGLAVNVTIEDCQFRSESGVQAYAYANDSYSFRLLNNRWYSGLFGGWDRGSYGVETGNVYYDVGPAGHEEGEGSNHLRIANNTYINQHGTSSYLIGGTFYYSEIEGNLIQGAHDQIPIGLAGFGTTVAHNTLIDTHGGITFLVGSSTSDLQRPHDIIVAGNYVSTRMGVACLYPPQASDAYNIQFSGNIFDCPNPVAWYGGVVQSDRNGFSYYGNTEINSTTGVVSGGLVQFPLFSGKLKSVYSFSDGSYPDTYDAGDIVIASHRTGNDANTLAKLCVSPGTMTTLSGVSGSTQSGSDVLTLTSGKVVQNRYYIIPGVSGIKHMVKQLSATSWRMDSAADASVTDAKLSYAVPQFRSVALQ